MLPSYMQGNKSEIKLYKVSIHISTVFVNKAPLLNIKIYLNGCQI